MYFLASQDMVKVRRDLFASPNKRRKKAISLSNRANSPDKSWLLFL